MGYYLIRKLSYATATLIGVITAVFFLFNVIPGDPAQMMLGQNESAEQLELIYQRYGFDQPMWKQYVYYLNDLSPISVHHASKDSKSLEQYNYSTLYKGTDYHLIIKRPYLRASFQSQGVAVSHIIGETLPNTILLATIAIVIAFIFGIAAGIISCLAHDTWLDKLILLFSTLGMSLPSFFSAILFSWIFGFVLHEYTGLPMTGSLYVVDDLGRGSYMRWQHVILPAIVLGIRPIAVISQLMRNALLSVLSCDYIRTARAKGLSELQVITRHAMKNAMNPVITALSGWFAGMLGGAVFVEYIFGWNGLGKQIVMALNTQDLPVIMGGVLTIATLFVVINILVDLLYPYLDPRIKLS